MTGFGAGDAPLGDGRVAVEIRSLNHRYLDVRVRTPTELGDQGFFVEQLARERLSRGRYDVGIRLEGAALPPPRLSPERVRAVYRQLCELRDELSPGSELSIGVVATIPDVFESTSVMDVETVRGALSEAFHAACAALDQMRSDEGRALHADLGGRVDAAAEICEHVASRVSEVVEAQRQRLSARLERLLADAQVSVDAGRLETELAILADKSDITEELVRLRSHFEQFRALLSAKVPVGRRMDFLLQEIGREVNTIGSKSQDSDLAQHVVALKAEVERMREQVQNVE